MSSPQELHVRFRHQSTNYDLHLVKGVISDHSVKINGVTYSVLGDEEKLKKACEILNSVSLDSIGNSQDLQGRLALREDLSFSTESIDDIGVSALSVRTEEISAPSEAETVVELGKGAAMDQLLESLVKHRGFAGVVLVVDHGKTILKKGYGKATIRASGPMSSKTRFPIGSVTKPITSLAILKLIEEGIFIDPITAEKIQDPAKIKILDFLPKSCQPEDRVKASWEGVTLLDLMNHTGGFPSFPQRREKIEEAKMAKKYPFLSAVDVTKLSQKKRTNTPLLPKEIRELMEKYPILSSVDEVFKLLQKEVVSTPLSPQEWVDLIRNDNLKSNLKDTLSETGGKYNYSNFGYVLLGKIIENVSGDTYASFMNHFLQDELGLKETGYIETDASDAIYGEPLVWSPEEQSSFSADKDELDPPVEAYSAGGLYSTVEDLQALARRQMKLLTTRDGVKVKKDPRKDPDFRQEYTCAKGWNISSGEWADGDGKPVQEVWKTGAVGGYGSLMVLYPNQNSSIVILSNQPNDVEAITTDLSHVLCLSGGSKTDTLGPWEGVYRIPNWGLTFSIAKQGSQYVFRETHPSRHEAPLDGSSSREQVIFPWGPDKVSHSIREINNQLCLCGPNGFPIPGALVDKLT